MARYDSPGWSSPLPGAGSGTDRAYTAPGSDGIMPGHGGGQVGTPVISSPYESSQVAEARPAVPVSAGDTASTSSGYAVPPSGPWWAPPGSSYTGAGRGAAGHFRHPDGGDGDE